MRAKREKKQNPEPGLSWLLYLLLVLLIVVYAAYGNIIVGAVALLLIVFILVFEVKTSVESEGTKKSIVDVAVAVGAALLVWVLLIVLLHTTAPVDAVTSCSMLPALHRGDLVVLSGIVNLTSFIARSNVSVVNVDPGAFDRMQGNMTKEFLVYYAYFNDNKSQISFLVPSNDTQYKVGLYSNSCVSQKEYYGESKQLSQCYVSSQQGNLITYSYSIGKVSTSKSTYSSPYTSQIIVGNATISENYTNPVIVYQTTSKDEFSGTVIHRLYAILNVSGSYYFLTKGDNNQALDIEAGNYPINRSEVLGYVIADIPIVGYVKLLLSGQIATPAGCNQTLSTH